MPEIIVPGAFDSMAQPATPAAPAAIVDGFLPAELAQAMRQDIDAHFAEPYRHTAETHQVWNYWYVPNQYIYLRTNLERVIARDRALAFYRALNAWSLETLGLGTVTWPLLSLYINGCRQGWHNDFANGRFAFVYSLTREQRATIGGETLVMRGGDGLRDNLTRPTAAIGFYEAIAPRFNRLVVFDDRAPHAVEAVSGSMDPVEGRFVLHGHLSEGRTAIRGSLPPGAVTETVDAILARFADGRAIALMPYQGPLSFRLSVDANGAVTSCDILLDRVLSADPGARDWDGLRETLCDQLENARFPTSGGETTVILPVMFGVRPRAMR